MNRVFVGNLSWNTTAKQLGELFEKSGPVKEAVIVSRNGRSLGFGFVTMSDEAAAKSAIANNNQKELDGRTIRVELSTSTGPHPPGPNPRRPRGAFRGRGRGGFRGRGRGRGRQNRRPRVVHNATDPVSSTRIHVRNLPYSLKDSEFAEAFKGDNVKEAIIIRSNYDGRSRGYGFVECANHEQQEKLLAKKELTFGNRTAYLAAAYERVPREQKPASQ